MWFGRQCIELEIKFAAKCRWIEAYSLCQQQKGLAKIAKPEFLYKIKPYGGDEAHPTAATK